MKVDNKHHVFLPFLKKTSTPSNFLCIYFALKCQLEKYQKLSAENHLTEL